MTLFSRWYFIDWSQENSDHLIKKQIECKRRNYFPWSYKESDRPRVQTWILVSHSGLFLFFHTVKILNSCRIRLAPCCFQLSKTSGFTLLFLWSYPRIDSETKVKGCKQRSFAGLIDMSANVPKSWSMWKSLGSLFRMLTPNTHPFGFSRPRSWSVGIWQTSQGTGGRWSMDSISSNSVWITWSRRSITTLTEETSGTFDSQTASALVSLSLLNDFLYFPLVYQ